MKIIIYITNFNMQPYSPVLYWRQKPGKYP